MMLADLRYGLRMLAKNPAFSVMAVLILALGIGANTAIFSMVNGVLIAPLPFRNPGQLAMLWEHSPNTGPTNVVNPINFLEWQGRNHSFERIAAMVEWPISLSGAGEPEKVDNMAVSNGFFEILGVRPIVGRWFTPREDTPGHDNLVILGEALWRRRYGADPNIVGRKILYNTSPVTVVGVMPGGFRFPSTQAVLWTPLAINRAQAIKRGRYLWTVARLKRGVTLASAQADMDVIARQLERERPDFDARWGIRVVGLREQAVGDVRRPLLILFGAVALVLLIACANVANLMLMRAAERGREIAVRSALGASASRIVRQLMAESTVTAALGGGLGLLFGISGMKALVALLPDTAAYLNLRGIQIDRNVFLFTASVGLGTAIVFGLLPALKAARTDVQSTLKEGGRGTSNWRSRSRGALVVFEVALTMTLATGAGLLIRSFENRSSVNPGFDAAHVLSMQINTSGRFKSDREFLSFLERTLDGVRAMPGVEAAGTSHFVPLGRIIPATDFWRADQPEPAHGSEPDTEVLVTMPGYFSAMNIPLIRGRVFNDTDRSGAPLAVVVNQTLARKFYPNENPIGKRLHVDWGDPPNDVYQIIGIVGDVHQTALDQAPKPGVFISNLQQPTGPVNLVVRLKGDPRQFAGAIRRQIRALAAQIPISDVRTMDEYVSSSVAAPRFHAVLLGSFAMLALALAAAGLFGVVSYSVSQRTRELGIRRALGADRFAVMQLVVCHGLAITAVGIAVGLGFALLTTRLLTRLLYGVTPGDPLTFAGVSVVLAVVAFFASYLPARHAAKVDPMEALRYE